MRDELWLRLEQFVFDLPGIARPFSRRLAQENGWSEPFARRVVDEYRRFVWLAVRAGHPVTPSPAIDAAWHLHLVYSRSYWDELCGRVLGRPLHHEPTRGGPTEAAKFDGWYARTLASYREHFGEPPADLWPVEREARVAPHAPRRRRRWLAVAGALLLATLAGCGMTASTDLGMWPWLVVALVLVVVVSVAHASQRGGGHGTAGKDNRKDGKKDGGHGSCGGGGGCGGGGCGGSGCGGGGCGGD
jgi:hypothetical protein